ncbi:MAG: PilZ domain-containing protein [Bacillota bacterium]
MDESSMMKNRRSRRSPVLLTATLEVLGSPVPVKLRNLSEEGALVEGERLPLEGSTTFFTRNELRLKSRVVWVQGCYAGVAFDVPLKPEQVLRNVPQPKPRAQVDYKRPGFASRPLTERERKMVERWMTASPMGSPGD